MRGQNADTLFSWGRRGVRIPRALCDLILHHAVMTIQRLGGRSSPLVVVGMVHASLRTLPLASYTPAPRTRSLCAAAPCLMRTPHTASHHCLSFLRGARAATYSFHLHTCTYFTALPCLSAHSPLSYQNTR